MINFIFMLEHSFAKHGQRIFISGSCKELGYWDHEKSLELLTNEKTFPHWLVEIGIEKYNQKIEFKFLIKENEMVIWESIQNRVIDLNQFRADVLEFIKFHWVKKKKFKKKKMVY